MQKDNQITTTQIENLDAKYLLSKFNIITKHFERLESLLNKPTTLEFLTIKEVCQILKVSKVTVHNWTKQGILKPYKIGNQTRFKRLEVLDALEQKAK